MTSNNKKAKLKGEALVNKVALIITEIIMLALIFGFISDYTAGNATRGYFITFEIVAVISAVVILCVYKFKPTTMKYVTFANFAVTYAVLIFGAKTDVAFVAIFPIIIVFVLYYDYKLIFQMAVVFSILTVADCVYIAFILKHLHSGVPVNSSVLLMEILGTVIALAAATVATKITKQNNDEKVKEIQDVSDRVNESIKEINLEIVQLNESTSAAKLAMEEINTGVTGTAEAVQNQLIQTQEIQNRIEKVQSEADNIHQNVGATMSAVESGSEEVKSLLESAEYSVQISDRVITDLNALKNDVGAMNGITKIIDNIAFQTNIMALNANVEAARAGKAGKGFAVVATEISNMSAKTKEATDEISSLISGATASLEELVRSVTEMAKVIESEKVQTVQTTEIFGDIKNNTEEVSKHVAEFMGYINGLTDANREIVESVSTISAATEEVTALSGEAVTRELDNEASVQSIADQIGILANNQ